MTARPRRPAEYYGAVLAVFVLTRLVAFLFCTASEYGLYQRYGDAARHGSLATLYQTEDVEYPQLAVLLGSAAGWVTDRLPDGVERLVALRPNKFGDLYQASTPAERLAGDRYEVGLAVVLFAADLACLGLVFVIARRVYPADGPRERAARLLAYSVFTAALGLILFDRQDLVVGLFALLALWPLAAGRPTLGYVALVVGTAYKLVPVLLLPVWVLAAAAARAAPGATPGRYLRAVVREAAVAGLVLALWPVGVYLWGGGERGFLFLTFHSARGLQVEAPAAWPVLAFDPSAEVGHGYGSHNVRCPAADRIAGILRLLMAASVPLTVAVAARGFWRAARHGVPSTQYPVPSTQYPVPSTQYPVPSTQPSGRRSPEPPRADPPGTAPYSVLRTPYSVLVPHVVASSLLVWLGFVVTNKVGSPQYLLWVAPLVPLLPLRTRPERAWAGLLLANMLLTTAVYPCGYKLVIGEVVRDDPVTWSGPTTVALVLLAAKSLTLIAATGWLALSVWRNSPLSEDAR